MIAGLLFFGRVRGAAEPNPPNWDTSAVKIIDPSDGAASQKLVDDIYTEMGGWDKWPLKGHWSPNRYALMFKPGKHQTKVNVGFYTQVIGLGESPTDTTIANLTSPNGWKEYNIGALCNFWRGAENIEVDSSMDWAVSQAVSMRRCQINGNLNLY